MGSIAHFNRSVRPLLAFAQDVLNLAPAQSGARDLVRTRFNQCMLLAVLLHIWLVAVLGSAPGGNAPPGEGSYGSLSVRLQGPVAQAGADASVQPPDSGPPGQARQQRSGGAVRPLDEPVLQDQAGAETSGNWRPVESQADPNLAERPLANPQIRPLTPSTVETLPELPRPTATLSDTAQTLAPAKPAPPARLTPSLVPDLTPLPSTAYDALRPPLTMKDTVQRVAPVPAAPPSKLSPTRTPELTPLATPNFEALHPAATMNDTAARAMAAPALPSPGKLSAVKAPELAPLPAQDFDELRPTATLSDTAARPAPAATRPPAKLPASATPTLTPLPAHSLDTIAPPAERRTATLGESTNSTPVPASEVPRAPAKLPSANVPELAPLPKVDAVGPAVGSAVTAPQAAVGDAPKGATASPAPAPGGAPNAGAQTGHDVATAPSAAPGPKPLNLNLPLARGPMASSHGSTGVLPVMPKPAELKSDVEKAIEKGKRADCRNAYGEQLGLLAAVPLAIDAARDKGCKW